MKVQCHLHIELVSGDHCFVEEMSINTCQKKIYLRALIRGVEIKTSEVSELKRGFIWLVTIDDLIEYIK